MSLLVQFILHHTQEVDRTGVPLPTCGQQFAGASAEGSTGRNNDHIYHVCTYQGNSPLEDIPSLTNQNSIHEEIKCILKAGARLEIQGSRVKPG